MTSPHYLHGLTIKLDLYDGWCVFIGDSATAVFKGGRDAIRADAEAFREAQGNGYPAHVLAQQAERDAVKNRVYAARSEIEAVEGEHAVWRNHDVRAGMIEFCVIDRRCIHFGNAYTDEPDAEALAMERLRDAWVKSVAAPVMEVA